MEIYPVTTRTSLGLGTGDSPEFAGLTLTGNLIIPNDGYIGSVGVPTAIQVDATGDVTLYSDLTVTNDLVVDAIQSAASTYCKIDMVPATDEIAVYPGYGAADNFIVFKSEDATASSPQIYPYTDNEGQLGLTDHRWNKLWVNHIDLDESITMVAGKTVDGRDVSADGTTLDAVATTYLPLAGGLIATTGEIDFRDTDISIGSTLADGILDMSADGSIRMFYDNADVGDAVDGQSLYVYRRAEEGDGYIRAYVDKDRHAQIYSDRSLYLESAGTILLKTVTHAQVQLGDAAGNIKFQIYDSNSSEKASIDSDGNFQCDGNIETAGNLIIADAGYIGSASDTDAIQIEADGDVVLTQDLILPTGDFYATNVVRYGDVTTFISFPLNSTFFFQAGGVEMMKFDTLVKTPFISVNGGGVDVDFYVEGLNDPLLLYCNAGTDKVGIGTDTPDTKFQVVGDSGFGDDAGNELLISNTGVVTLAGTAKRDLTLRADLDYTLVTAQGKPTQVIIGIMHGYSLPLYAADEELYFNENVPGRWDGASDIKFHVLVALASAETADETFKFQLSWNQVGETDIVPATSHDTTDEIVVVDGTQYATYMLEFVIDHDVDAGDVIVPHDDLAARLRRVASTGDEVDGEIIVLDWHTHYTVDKMFKAPD